VVRLLNDRFKGFREERLDILMQVFYQLDHYSFFEEEHFDRVLIGTPVWASTPLPKPMGANRTS
jgi:hypothetical protein